MSKGHFGLRGKETYEIDDTLEWGRQLEKTDRRVANDMVGDIRVSTVFLGLDHSFGGVPPLLFETMVFGGKHDQDGQRYATWDEAEAGHKKWLERVKWDSPLATALED